MTLSQEDVVKIVTKTLKAAGKTCGQLLADHSAYGSAITAGEQHPSTRRHYIIVLATNDMADRLSEWLTQEGRERMRVARDAGLSVTHIEPGKP